MQLPGRSGMGSGGQVGRLKHSVCGSATCGDSRYQGLESVGCGVPEVTPVLVELFEDFRPEGRAGEKLVQIGTGRGVIFFCPAAPGRLVTAL